MDCSLPGSSVHRILQARILGWVAIPPPGDLPNPGIEPPLSRQGSPTNQWRSLNVDGETVSDFTFLGSKITADGDYSHEIKTLGRKFMTNLDSIFKSKDITLTKVHLVKALVFPVVMCGYESWALKKAER